MRGSSQDNWGPKTNTASDVTEISQLDVQYEQEALGKAVIKLMVHREGQDAGLD